MHSLMRYFYSPSF